MIEQIARSLAERLNVKLRLIGHPSPPAPIECLKAEECDVGFLGFLQHRAWDVGFSPPYIMVPFTFMVPAGSSIHTIEDVDKAGIRIAAVRNHASSLALSRIRKHAKTLDVEVPDEAFELLRTGRADAWASPRPPLLEYSPRLPDSRVLEGSYGANRQSIAVPKNQVARLEYITEFIEQAKVSGALQQAIEGAGSVALK